MLQPTAPQINDGDWHNITFVYDSDSASFVLYVDGDTDNPVAEANPAEVPSLVGGHTNAPGIGAIHADGRISDKEMKHLMIKASESMTKLLAMKQDTPYEYDRFIRDYGQKFCDRWER